MNVALPEIDGRILSRAVSFKAPLGRDPETEADLVGYRPVADRVAFVADLARNWARLRARPPAERRIAIVLANYPNRDGRIGNGVGLDTPASAVAILRALREAGYRDRRRARRRRRADAAAARRPDQRQAATRQPRRRCPSPSTRRFSPACRRAVQRQVSERWGSAERDPFFRPGGSIAAGSRSPASAPATSRCGIQPARGYNIDPKSTYHDPALVPPHSYLAVYAWLRRQFPRRCGDRSRQARHPRMAAGQGAGAVGGMFSRGGARAAAASLPVHRQRSRRGQPGEAAGAGGHRRSPDPAADPRRAATGRWPSSSG